MPIRWDHGGGGGGGIMDKNVAMDGQWVVLNKLL